VKATEFELNPEVQVKWLPMTIRIFIDEAGKVSVVDLDSVNNVQPLTPNQIDQNIAADYELMSVVAFIKDIENEDKNNLVAVVKVDPAYFERAGQVKGKTGWFLFNDFRYVFCE